MLSSVSASSYVHYKVHAQNLKYRKAYYEQRIYEFYWENHVVLRR